MGGRPPTPPELKAARRLTKTEFEVLVNKFLWADTATLIAYQQDPSLTTIERMMCSVISAALQDGEPKQLEFFLTRLLGKPKDTVEVITPKPYILEKLDGTQLEMGSRLEEKEE